MRKTKIICTLGPSTDKDGVLEELIKEGDDIYYRRACGVPVPFFRQGFEVVAEQQIQAVINEGLTERFKNIV